MMNYCRKVVLAVAMSVVGFFVPCGRAAVVPVSPVNGKVFQLLPRAQREVLAGNTREERQRVLKELGSQATGNSWRCSCPLVLKWNTTNGEVGPWRIRLSESADLSDAREFWFGRDSVKMGEKDASGVQSWSYEVPFANLDLGKTLYWQVWSNVSCPGHDCGFTYPDTCKCGRARHGNISPVASFSTSAEPPRWIALEGKTGNVRDIGGWKTADGRCVKTGLVFRGQGLNENSVSGLDRGRVRLTVEDVRYMTETLGIKTDLDLRGSKETGQMGSSPLGRDVKLIKRAATSPYYSKMFQATGMKTMAENFRLFCDSKNYPIYFHCIGGADRTGSLAYVLNGVLGVEKEDLERDYESTFYNEGSIPGVEDPKHGRGTQHFDAGFAKYGNPDDALQRRIELYLLDCGVAESEIAAFRSIMLEP